MTSFKIRVETLLSLSLLSFTFTAACMPPPVKPTIGIGEEHCDTSGCGAVSDNLNPEDPSSEPEMGDEVPALPLPIPATATVTNPAVQAPLPVTPVPTSTSTPTPAPAPSVVPAPAPAPLPAPTPATTGGAEVTTTNCSGGETWTFGNYPSAWTINKTGRIKDAMANESIVQDPEKGTVMKVKYGKGTSSPSASRERGLVPGGTQFIPDLKNTYNNAVMSYWIKFPSDFECVKGGKLPGIASNIELLSGGETADGTNGFSMRLMWRENCTAEVYGYLPRVENQHLKEKYGDSLTQNATTGIIYGWSIGRGKFSFPKGKWTKVDVSVKVNDVGQKNGTVKVALDGKQVFQRDEIVYRTTDKLKTGALFFSTFFGGSDATYAALKDETISFGDMAICPNK